MDFNYVIFTHLPWHPDPDQAEKPWKALEDWASDLADKLSNPAAPGMVVAFYDPGWSSLLNSIGTDFNPESMADDFQKLATKEAEIKGLIGRYPKLRCRLRLITAKDLYKILNNLRGNKPGLEATRLRTFLVGDDPGIRYDTTKVVEAILRVRHLGSGIPVLRLDWDVLLNETTIKGQISFACQAILNHCNKLGTDHRVHSYMISGRYDHPTGAVPQDINAYNSAFATRIFPALVPTGKAVAAMDETSKEGKDRRLGKDELKALQNIGMLDEDVMERYYGIGRHAASGQGLARLGSDPTSAVISGAGLVLSDGAIHDLPPFSNFRLYVMWIDDHLKYELHRALAHLPDQSVHSPHAGPQLDVPLFKDRTLAGQSNLRPYTLGTYIPTLFYGIIMDAWIRGEAPSLSDPKTALDGTPFVLALGQSLKRGTFEARDRERLAKELHRMALERIRVLIKLWSQLVTGTGDKSFAALWVSGKRAAIERVLGNLTREGDGWPGWGLLEQPVQAPEHLTSLDQLRPPLQNNIELLVEDACAYIDWVLEWPKFIQSVRAERNGSLRLDVHYDLC